MSFGIEDPLIDWQDIFGSKEQEKILQCLRQEETLLPIIKPIAILLRNISQTGIASTWNLAVLLNVQSNLVAPSAVLGIAGDAPHQKDAFDDFGTE